jgi:hypothetical protein
MSSYKVAVFRQGRHYCVYLYEFECFATGVTVGEALANLRLHAADTLEQFADCPSEMPPPSDITIATVELPPPSYSRTPTTPQPRSRTTRRVDRLSVAMARSLPADLS